MTLREAARQLGLTSATLRQQLAAGRLRGRKDAHGFWTITAGELERYRAEQLGRRGPRRRP